MKGTAGALFGKVIQKRFSKRVLYLTIPTIPFFISRGRKGQFPVNFFQNFFIRKVCREVPLSTPVQNETKKRGVNLMNDATRKHYLEGKTIPAFRTLTEVGYE